MAPSVVSLTLLVLLILCAMLHPSSASGGDMLMLDRFHRWMSAHGRSYGSADEKLRRLEVYRHNVEFIEATNRESERLGHGYELGENEFTDLTNEEFVARYTGAAVPEDDDVAAYGGTGSDIITTLAGDVNEGHALSSMVDLNSSSPVPESFDWRSQGAVTRARSQGSCGSCWAFATVSTVESLHKIKNGVLLDLSEQEVLDCDVAEQKGCNGGYPGKALQWIQARGGVAPEVDYPYQALKGQCKSTNSSRRYGKITGVKGPVRGEPQLKTVVLRTPLVVLIDANGAIFQHYKGGIYQGPCTTKLNHAVVLVGYGVRKSDGVEYWSLKNSWGEKWGLSGFFYMRRGADGEAGLCGVALKGVYPVM